VTKKKLDAIERQVKLKEQKKEVVFKPGNKAWKKLDDAYRRKIMAKEQARRDKEMEKGPKTGEAYRVNVWIEGAAETEVEIGLKLTYLVRNASWEPRYDASLDTSVPNPVLQLLYHAHVKNMTGETWEDCQIVLSTSQATFHGLSDQAPRLALWSIRFAEENEYRHNSLKEKAILYSNQENEIRNPVQKSAGERVPLASVRRAAATAERQAHPMMARSAPQACIPPAQVPPPRPPRPSGLFGYAQYAEYQGQPQQMQLQQMQQQQQQQQQQGQMQQMQFQQAAIAASSSERSSHRRSVKKPSVKRSSFFGGSGSPDSEPSDSSGDEDDDDHHTGSSSSDEEEEADTSDADAAIRPNRLRFATPTTTSNGLTTIFTLPNNLTMPSSPLPRRHLLASLSFPKTRLQHLTIPKLRPAVFLKAIVLNTTSTPLLKGTCGFTLDGAFLGTLPIPKANCGEKFTVQLGVDSSVEVEYKKPTKVKQREKGMSLWNKEAGIIYRRGMIVHNNRTTPVSLVVIDQVPRSEDEKVVVTVKEPAGLEVGGEPVPAGEAFTKGNVESREESRPGSILGGKRNSFIGKLAKVREEDELGEKGFNVVAVMKKEGFVRWSVDLAGGKGVGLALDWEVRYPKEGGVVTV
jgi:hypothetical protein